MQVELKAISKSYENPAKTAKRTVLQDINLQIAQGETIAVTGASGTGKSTLLNLIGTLDKPDSGQIILDNQNLESLRESDLAQIRNQKIGFIFQQHHLMPQLNVLENILLPTLAFKNRTNAEKRAHELINFVGLKNVISQNPGQLSGGECQRVAVVRALINQPTLLLADEPTGSLDEQTANQLMELLLSINKDFSISIIMVTHARELAQKMQKHYALAQSKIKEMHKNL